MPPLTGDRRLALVLVAGLTAIFLALLPVLHVQFDARAYFIPAIRSALLICAVLTVVILYGRFSVQRTPALLVLGSTYLFAALTMSAAPEIVPGMFLTPLMSGEAAKGVSWLLLREMGFPLFVLAYVAVKHRTRPLAHAKAWVLGVPAALVVVIAAYAVTASFLPPLMTPANTKSPGFATAMDIAWALDMVALAALVLRRPHSTLDWWLIVVTVAWICQAGLSTVLINTRYTLGYYTGRIYELVAGAFVLVMLLVETRALYARLARELVSERAAAEGRADAAEQISHDTAETLRAVVDASSLAVLALSPQGTVLLWNKTAERLFGFLSEEVLGRPYPLMPDNKEVEGEQRALFARALAGEFLRDQRFRCRRKDGSEPAVRGSAAPFRDRKGELRGVAFALEDITEKNATEEMLRQSQKMEAVGQLTGGVAHDFNNILMVILANVEELQEDESLAPEHRELLRNIAASGERAAELTRRLLAFSRKQRLMPQPTNLTDLVAGTDKLLRRTLGEQIEMDAVFAENLWTVNVDRTQVEAALVNLCVNARDAMPSGGKLMIETANEELDDVYAAANPGVVPGEYVMLAVSDTGTGIPAELLSKVFEPFFTTKEVGKGTGLGLSMVYGFLKQSNGHIKIYSEVGRGTTIRMYLPRSAAPIDAERRVEAPLPRGKERVLLVEDDPQVRAAVLSQLRSLGYAVSEASGGQAALDLIDAGAVFDLMLSDVVMPGIDGPQAAGLATERCPGLKVLFMSGYSENAALSHGRVAAGAQVLSKPFRKIDLAKRIREVLDQS